MPTPKTTRNLNYLLAVLWLLSGQPAAAQLSEKLRTESPIQLAKDAREQGDAIRGAILFPQESLACTKCHAAFANDSIGPNLTRLKKDRTDVFLVESILDPSKEISEGFATTTVLTLSGKIHSGRLLSSSADQLVLRENSDDQKRLTLDRSEIDEMATNPKSLMPDGLADQLKNRQQFLDLIRYLMELRDSGDSTSAPVILQSGKLDAKLQGLALIDGFQCTSCHTNNLIASDIPPKSAPRLTRLVDLLDPAYIEQFIADPSHAKPGTDMPDVLTAVPAEERSLFAQQITHYLAAKSERRFESATTDAEAAARGKELFHSVGCVACHSPRNALGEPLLAESSVSLGPLRYSLEGLIQFLEDPHAVRPSGRMPNMKLNHWEATDLANYLLSLSNQHASTAFQLDPLLAEAGQRRFQQLQCANCHGEAQVLQPLDIRPASPPLADVRLTEGCLSKASGGWPKFDFRESEVDLIRDAITSFRSVDALTNEQQIQLSMATFRCTVCHQRGTLGGVPDERNDYFETTNPNLGPQGRIPPTLTDVGAKLRPKWMREVLVSGRSIRPYVKTRMPQYGAPNVEHLIALFQNSDQLPDVDYPDIKDRDQQKLVRDAGLELVGDNGLNCIACHTFQQKPAMTMPAVDLTEMHERLKPDWFYHYMLDPKRFHRGTVMPAFWPGGRSVRDGILDGDTDQQIAAIWEWMKDGRQARTPRGLIRQPMELLATDEAVMLRRSYPGIGKRGIGVGYPQLVNLAFDAEQMRVGLLWQGKFADPSGVWSGQGHGMVRPLAREQIKFLPGPEIDDRENPWIVDDGRPPHHQFKGYVLDKVRRPTFLYQFEDVSIADYCVDLTNSGVPMIRRTITLESNSARAGLAFRLAPEDPITARSATEFEVGDTFLIRVQTPDTGAIVEGQNGRQLQIAIDLKVSQPKQLILEYEWQSQTGQ